MSDPVVKLYGAGLASWSGQEHLLGLLSLGRFGAAEGFDRCVPVSRSG